MKQFRLINNLVGWLVFAIATITYMLTIEDTASLWDCGEFITSAYKLEVGHPPGAPFFMLLGRFFTLFAGGEALAGGAVAGAGYMINVMSALSSSFCILFLFWSITHLGRRFLVDNEEEIGLGSIVSIIGAGMVGALAYTFSDSFWYSAVEGEVYAMSSLFTAVVFWLILKWEENSDSSFCNRWLVLIMYLMGLSIGVHLLNLLTIPALVLVIYFKKFPYSHKGLLITLAVSFGLIMVMMKGIVPGVVFVASRFELLFVNGFGLAVHVGTVFYIVVLFAVLGLGLYITGYSDNKMKGRLLFALTLILMGIPFLSGSLLIGLVLSTVISVLVFAISYRPQLLNLILTCLTVIFIGYSSFALIVIRSDADTPMNQNSPDNTFSLQSYLNREQYGSVPLLRGGQYTAQVINYGEGSKIYDYQDGKYVHVDNKIEPEMDYAVFFPRMHSGRSEHIRQYERWVGAPKATRRINGRVKAVPSSGQNIKFFLDYQMNWMYWRYFMWNFAGRQNDKQGFYAGDKLRGNWISGIPFIDNARLGDQSNLPTQWASEKSRNRYFMLPLLLGLVGIGLQLFSKNKRGLEFFAIISMLFVLTGIAIVVYLNQGPMEPRERDYAYAGSFYAFAIWIGLGVLAFVNHIKNEKKRLIFGVLGTLLCLVAVPGVMLSENWDDHDRSGRTIASDIARNYLESCEPNAIIFTYGDNDTFPLWYLQEVEGVRQDVRVCNLSYLQAGWYIQQMFKKAYSSESLPFTLRPDIYRDMDAFEMRDSKDNEPIDLMRVFKFMNLDDDRTFSPSGRKIVPSKVFSIPVDKEFILASGMIPKGQENAVESSLTLKLGEPYKPNERMPQHLLLKEVAMLDIIASNEWNRPIYFASTVGSDNHLQLTAYLHDEGLARRLLPFKGMGVNVDKMYENVMTKFRFGGLKESEVFLDLHALRTFSNLRRTMLSLAHALLYKDDPARCSLVLERCEEEFPEKSIAWGHSSLSDSDAGLIIARLYANLVSLDKDEARIATAKAQGLKHAERVMKDAFAELQWFCSQERGIYTTRDGIEGSLMQSVRAVYLQALEVNTMLAEEGEDVEKEALEALSKLYMENGVRGGSSANR